MLNKNPNDIEALKLAGELYIELGKYNDALEIINKCIEIDPNYGVNNRYTARGFLYSEYFFDNEKAIKDYNRAIQLDIDNDNSYYWRGRFYQLQDNYEMALEDYKQARELNPEDGIIIKIAYNYYALACYQVIRSI